MNKPAIKNILANFAVHVVKCHKKGVEPNLNPWADLFTNKPITEEQVVSSENPDTGTTISTGGEMMYVQADWKDLYREELAEEKLKARKQALKEVLELTLMKDENILITNTDTVDFGKYTEHPFNELRQQLRASIKKLMEVEK